MKKIIWILIISQWLWGGQYTRDSATSIITDHKNRIQWYDNAFVGQNWEGAINTCEALSVGGYSDWRLPNINTLVSILNDSIQIDSAIFVNLSIYINAHNLSRILSSNTDILYKNYCLTLRYVNNYLYVSKQIKTTTTDSFICVRDWKGV